jgi:glycosyltransferase involved in cell wall biosynthesis
MELSESLNTFHTGRRPLKVVIVCGMSDEKARDKIAPIVRLPEVDVVFLVRRQPLVIPKVISYAPPSGIRRNLALSELFRILALIYVCLVKRPQVLIGIYFVPHGIYAGVIGSLLGKRVIQILIGTDRLKIEASSLYIKILKNAEFVGVRGHASQKALTSLGIPSGKIFIPSGVNAIDFDHFIPGDIEKRYDLIYVGRMDQNKQVAKLLQAAALLHPGYPGLRVALVGDGPERGHLEELTSRLNLMEVVSFLGDRPSVDIPNHLRQSRIFVMASSFEGLPVAMIEALCCGLPVVVPNVGDISDVAIHRVNALLVDPPTVEGFFQTINSLMGNGQLYEQLEMGALATRERLISEYSLARAQEIWWRVLFPDPVVNSEK